MKAKFTVRARDHAARAAKWCVVYTDADGKRGMLFFTPAERASRDELVQRLKKTGHAVTSFKRA